MNRYHYHGRVVGRDREPIEDEEETVRLPVLGSKKIDPADVLTEAEALEILREEFKNP